MQGNPMEATAEEELSISMAVAETDEDAGVPLLRSGSRRHYGSVSSEGKDDHTLEPPKEASVKSQDSIQKVELKRTLTLFNGAGLIMGTIIGSGIFVSPKGVLQESNSPGCALVIWGACGLICLLGALCFAELGTCLHSSGGQYTYLAELGPIPAFLYLWSSLVITYPAANAVIALTFAEYVSKPFFPTCEAPEMGITLLAALSICLLTYVNCASVLWATRVQDIFTIIKTLALILIIITGLVWLCFGHTEHLQNSFEGTSTDPGRISLAFYSGLFSYSGWYTLNFLTEELKDPYRNLPLAICIALPLITVVYVLTNLAYFAVLPQSEILKSEAVAVTFAMKCFGVMAWTMPIFVACSSFGSLNGGLLSVSRVFYVGAREGHLPALMALINYELLTPFPAVLAQGLVSCLFLVTSDVYLLINYITLIESISFGLCIAVLLYLRWKQPNMERPIKVNLLLPIIFLLVSIFLIVFPIYQTPLDMAVALAILLSGLPVYFLGVRWKNKPACYHKGLRELENGTNSTCL